MVRLIAALLLACLAPLAAADTLTLSWSVPPGNEDGSPLSAGEIQWYILDEAANGQQSEQILPATQFSTTAVVPCGTAYFDLWTLTSTVRGASATLTYTSATKCAPQAPGQVMVGE